MSLGAAMVSMDGTIVLIAQPALQSDLGASLTQVQWVTTGYLLAVGTFLVIAGSIGDRIGYRYTFLGGVVGFAVTSGLMAGVHDIRWLIGLRVVQGLCGAFLQPATMGLLRAVFADDGLDMPIAIRSGAIGMSTAAGPVIGGLLVEHASWRAVFLINLPLGAITVVLALIALRGRPAARDAKPATGRFDLAGALLLAVLMFTLFYGVTVVSAHGILDVRGIALIVAVVVLGWLFARREKRATAPVLPPALFTSRNLAVGMFLVVCLAFAMIGTLFLATYYVQNLLGLDPVRGGILVLPLTITMIVAAPLSGIVLRKVGSRVLVGAGFCLVAVAVFGLSRIGANTGTGYLSLLLFVLGLGLAPTLVTTTKIIVANVPRSDGGLAGGLHQTGMQVGSGIGVGVLGTLLATRSDHLLHAALGPVTDATPRPGYLVEAFSDATVGRHHPIPGMPAALAATWDSVSRSVFLSAMSDALVAAVVVAVLGAAASVLVRHRDRR